MRERTSDNTHRSERYLVAVAIPVFIRIGWNARPCGRRLSRNSEADTRATDARRLFAANYNGWLGLLFFGFGGLGRGSLLPLLGCLG